jgi:two-component system, OmpR family, sensor kinase
MKSSPTLLAGFFSVVLLLTGSAAYSLWSTRRLAARIDALVRESLERERLIGLMRLDAILLYQDASDHINALDAAEKKSAENAMDVVLQEIEETAQRFAAGPEMEDVELWNKFNFTANALVSKVEVTIKASKRAEAERARRNLYDEAKPIGFELDATADKLAEKNAADTRRMLAGLQEVRDRANVFALGVVGLALTLSLLIASQMFRILRRQEKTIAQQVAQLNRRNEELDAFASRVTHDLMAPLAPLKGYLTLARRSAADGNTKELLEQAESSTKRMSELVEGLSRFSRAIEPSSQEDIQGQFDAAVSAILLEQSQVAEAAGVHLERDIAPGVLVKCPSQLLQSIAQNLIGNAVKYAAVQPRAKVCVTLSLSLSHGVLSVSDNGPGVSAAAKAHVFEPFFRAPETRTLPGNGLGLATTKRLVEAHLGDIEFVSAAGVGTTVTVRLPRALNREQLG